jgi:hypothetical protein
MLLEMIYRSLIDTKPNDIISELKMWEMAENTVSGTTIAGLSLKIANKGGRQVCISPFSPLPDRSIAKMQLSPSFFLLRGTFISRLLLAAGMVYIYHSEIHTIARRMLAGSTLAIEGWGHHCEGKGVPKTTVCARSTQKVARSPCTMKKHTSSSSR